VAATETRLIAGLKEAILTEQTGVEFYAVAARNTRDARGREVFEQLAREEADHQHWLKVQYQHLLENRPFENFRGTRRADLSGPSPIYSDELSRRVGEAHWEMTALSVGLALEHAAVARYRSLAGSPGRPEERRFFEELAAWEETHAAALKRQHDLLLESYWHQAQFAPF
jgi:rubrerythrin